MFKTLPLLVLMAVVNCQMGNKNDLESAIKNIFGTSFGEATEGSLANVKKRPSTLVPSLNSNYGNKTRGVATAVSAASLIRNPRVSETPEESKEDLSCTMKDGTVGQCVAYYLCDRNYTIVDDGVDNITAGTNSSVLRHASKDDSRSCSSYLDICCLPRNLHKTTIKPTPQPTMDDTILQEIFGSPRTPAIGDPPVNNDEDLSCTKKDGTAGKCVPYYLFSEKNCFEIDRSGGGRPCLSSVDVCCIPREPPPQPTSDDTINTPIKKTTEKPLVDKPSISVPSINSKNDGEEDLSCIMEDGTVGECIPYFLCDTNHTIVDDRAGVINGTSSNGTRSDKSVGGKPCLSYVDVCCLLRDVQPQEKVIEPPPQPTREGCGWRNPRGVDLRTTDETADKAKFGEFPWMVAIIGIEPVSERKAYGPKVNVYLCGGSLIHPEVVLTLAHCVTNASALRIRAGEWDTQTTEEIYPFQERDVTSVELHKDFNKIGNLYDAALLFLSERVTSAPNVGVACLPPPRLRTPAGIQCFATGWGKNKYGKQGQYQILLKKIELTVVKQKDCQKALRETHLGRFFQLHNSFVCAGGEEGRGTCLGDEGSPLSCSVPFHEERYIQSGIVAWGIGCGEPGIPGVYVDVSIVREWIDEKMISRGFDPSIYTI